MNKVVFFDRDGVINKKASEHDYIKTWDEFKLIPGIIDAMQHVQSLLYEDKSDFSAHLVLHKYIVRSYK